jgi:hypothetical protein
MTKLAAAKAAASTTRKLSSTMLGSFFVGGMVMKQLGMALVGLALALATVIGGRAFSADEKLSETSVFVNPAFLWLRKGALFNVSVDDGVTDGCWTNADSVKTAVELELQRSGFDIAEKKDDDLVISQFDVLLETLGFSFISTDNKKLGCVGHYKLSVDSAGKSEFIFNSNGHHLVYDGNNILWMESGLVVSSNLNKPFMDGFIDFIKSFLVDTDKIKIDVVSEARANAEKVPVEVRDLLESSAQAYWNAYKLD